MRNPFRRRKPTILDELHQNLIANMDQSPERPWQRVTLTREVFENGIVIEFGVNDVRW